MDVSWSVANWNNRCLCATIKARGPCCTIYIQRRILARTAAKVAVNSNIAFSDGTSPSRSISENADTSISRNSLAESFPAFPDPLPLPSLKERGRACPWHQSMTKAQLPAHWAQWPQSSVHTRSLRAYRLLVDLGLAMSHVSCPHASSRLLIWAISGIPSGHCQDCVRPTVSARSPSAEHRPVLASSLIPPNPRLPPLMHRVGFGAIFAGAGYVVSCGDTRNGSGITTGKRACAAVFALSCPT